MFQKYPNAGVIIAGDRNNLLIEKLLLIDRSLRQIVTKNTRKDKCLDVILTNMGKFYNKPIICPPIKPDNINQGIPSDHKVPVAIPKTAKFNNKEST